MRIFAGILFIFIKTIPMASQKMFAVTICCWICVLRNLDISVFGHSRNLCQFPTKLQIIALAWNCRCFDMSSREQTAIECIEYIKLSWMNAPIHTRALRIAHALAKAHSKREKKNTHARDQCACRMHNSQLSVYERVDVRATVIPYGFIECDTSHYVKIDVKWTRNEYSSLCIMYSYVQHQLIKRLWILYLGNTKMKQKKTLALLHFELWLHRLLCLMYFCPNLLHICFISGFFGANMCVKLLDWDEQKEQKW